jgi:hypothetical protein
MSETQHTPGPWRMHMSYDRRQYVVTGPEGEPFRGHVIAGPTTCPNWQGNARLIAAAPDLLAALEALVSFQRGIEDWPEVRQAEAAIRKAKGEG